MKPSPINSGPSTYLRDRYKGSGTPYRTLVTDLRAQATANKLPRAVKLLATFRELCLFLSDYEAFDEDYLTLMAGLIPMMKDNDNDNRKALRLVYFHVTELLTPLAARGQIPPQKIQELYQIILNDIGAATTNCSHRHLALRTAGVLAPLVAGADGGDQSIKKLIQLMEDPLLKLSAQASSTKPQTKKKSALKDYQEQNFLSSAYGCCLRRLTVCPPGWLAHTLALCCMDNDDTARHAFAALHRFVANDPETVALSLHQKLRPTTSEHGAMYLNVRDTLGCVHYLRVCCTLAYHPITIKVTEAIRDEFYRNIAKSVADTRLRVSLEAIRCLFSHGLESYHRMVAVENKLKLALLNQVASTLITAMSGFQTPEGSTSPSLHSILRVVLLVASTLRRGIQATTPTDTTPALTTPTSLNDTMAFLDMFHRGASTTPSTMPSPHVVQPPLPYQEEMRNLIRIIKSSGFLESKSPYISTAGLCAVVWLAPNPGTTATTTVPLVSSPSTAHSMDNPEEAWRTIHRLALAAVRHAPDDQLAQILQALQARTDLQPLLAPTLLPMLFEIAEYYFHKAPGHTTAGLLVKAWKAALQEHDKVAPRLVLESAFRVLDSNQGQQAASSKTSQVLGVDARVRAASVWAIQGLDPPSMSQARSALTRIKRMTVWFLGHYCTKLAPDQVPAVLVRLKTLAIFSDYHTRCVAVTALCKAALLLESLDLKLDVYEYLHSLEVAEFDLNICPDVKEEITSLSEVQGQAIDYLDQGGGLCLKDIICPAMACLEKHFEAVQAGKSPSEMAPLEHSLKDLLVMKEGDN